MFSIDTLRTADYYEWLGCGKRVGRRLGCHQSTVCRRWHEVSTLDGLNLAGERQNLLNLERALHQSWRFTKASDLRVHLYRWSHHLLAACLPAGWMANPQDLSVTRRSPLDLLEARILDAACLPAPLIDQLNPDRFTVIPLYSSPLFLLSPADAALSQEQHLSSTDIVAATSLGLLDFVPPEASRCSRWLDSQLFTGSGSDPTPPAVPPPGFAARYWGMALTPLICEDLRILDWQVPFRYAEFLVLLPEWREHGCIQALLQAFSSRLRRPAQPGDWLDRIQLDSPV